MRVESELSVGTQKVPPRVLTTSFYSLPTRKIIASEYKSFYIRMASGQGDL